MRNRSREGKPDSRPRGTFRSFGGATILASLLLAAPTGAESRTDRPTVVAVRFDSSARIDEKDFRRHLPVQAGEAIDETSLRAGLAWLRDKQIFDSVRAEVVPSGDDVEVIFHLEPRDFLVGIQVEGASSIDEKEILRKARLREDEPIDEARIRAAEERLRALYRERGYPEANVAVRTRPEGPGRIHARIEVREGLPRRVRSLEVRGVPEPRRNLLRASLPFREGDILSMDLADRAHETVRRVFRALSFFAVEAEVTVSGNGDVRLEVRPGPRFEIRFEGNSEISTEQLRALVDLGRRPVVTDGTWRLLGRRMTDLYREEGFPSAEVAVSISGDDPRLVTFAVREGRRFRIGEVRVIGAEQLGAEAISRIVEGEPGWWPHFAARTWFQEEKLREDVDRIESLYERSGFGSAEIVDVRRDFGVERSQVAITVVIEEGPQSIVSDIEIDPVPALSRGELRKALMLESGSVFAPDMAREDERRLGRRLAREGFVDAVVRLDVERGEPSGRIVPTRVRFLIEPGERVVVGDIRIQQNYFTLDGVIRHELGFETGDPLDPAALLEAQRDVYRLGLFRNVTVQPEPGPGEIRDVVIRVVERPGGELEYGFGYNTRAGIRNFLQLEHRNLSGAGRLGQLRGELNLSPRDLVPDEYLISLLGREPHVWNSGFDLRGNVVFQRSEREVDEFSIRRFALSTGLERELFEGFRASAMIELDDSRIFDVAPDAVLTGRDIGHLRTVSVGPLLVYDGRDDAFAPTRGVFETLQLRYGAPAFGSEIQFVKVNAQHAHRIPLSGGWSFLYAARAGFVEALGTSEDVPLRERFFLGGRNTVRGFDENSIGPRGDQGNPIGGDLVFSGNGEVRFPLFLGLEGAAFADAGGLFLREQGISLNQVRESAGPGLRYQTPIGAISLDYGFKLDRSKDESIGEVHFTIGNLF